MVGPLCLWRRARRQTDQIRHGLQRALLNLGVSSWVHDHFLHALLLPLVASPQGRRCPAYAEPFLWRGVGQGPHASAAPTRRGPEAHHALDFEHACSTGRDGRARGFTDRYGVAAKVAEGRGVVTTRDGSRRNLAIIMVRDVGSPSGYILVTDIDTGKTKQFTTRRARATRTSSPR